MRSCFFDQGGGERNMWGAPNVLGKGALKDAELDVLWRDLEDVDIGGMNYMFPRAWEHPGILHVYNNALQTAVMRLKEWPTIENALRGLSRFLSKKSLRDQFANSFIKQGDDEAIEALTTFSGGCFNWRWEKLEGLLELLSGILPVLMTRWRTGVYNMDEGDCITLESGAGDEEARTKKLVQGMVNGLKVPSISWWIEALLMVCRVVGREARWNEGCRCHGDCHVDESHPYPKRRRLIGGRVCEDQCPWKGRRTVEHVLGRVDILSGNLQQARSEKATQLLGRMKEMDRHKLLPAVPRIVASIVEELRFKLKFYREYPWVLLEVLAPLFGGSVEQSKSRAADALVFL